ncbi:MAG TPA: type II toxin-antitoxin system RelE/ParE family toxin [Paenibacillus sp.]|uniref:type II toxin-antitoxin system RelE/ParE family toxin n=1 Tax=Paenibacillus sp. TaxID=58172 RepID=UPI002B8B3547|nr:type II toxin-antitoxin system RelE/ParE family toxin [Paenibacillus sp.]HUC94053.1 type II toxin-antitoxin system RelE/ParE family toxin [Paenibacillus sp.]
MTSYNIVVTELAEHDLLGIADYIAKELREPSTAMQVVAAIGEAIMGLEQFPLRNGLVRDERLAAQGIRMLIVNNYIIFYAVSEHAKTVTIVRILYAKREWINGL